MPFTTAQVIEIAGIPKDTLRHWKKLLPPIAYIDGRSRLYSLAELVGVCLIAQATQGLGLPISRFQNYAEDIFNAIEGQLPPTGSPNFLCVTADSMFFAETIDPRSRRDIALAYISIGGIVEAVSRAINMAAFPPPPQMNLPF